MASPCSHTDAAALVKREWAPNACLNAELTGLPLPIIMWAYRASVKGFDGGKMPPGLKRYCIWPIQRWRGQLGINLRLMGIQPHFSDTVEHPVPTEKSLNIPLDYDQADNFGTREMLWPKSGNQGSATRPDISALLIFEYLPVLKSGEVVARTIEAFWRALIFHTYSKESRGTWLNNSGLV